MRKSKTLNLLMNCSADSLFDFNEQQYKDKKRFMKFYISWRKMLFTELYIDNKLVFVSCTDIFRNEQTRDVFNACKYGTFLKYAESEKEAIESLGFDIRELLDSVAFEIPDITAKYLKVNGCVCLDFADSNISDISAEYFSKWLIILYKSLVQMCDEFEKDYKANIEEELVKLTGSLDYEYNCVKSSTEYAVGFFRNNFNGKKDLFDSWNQKEYLHLSKWAFERKAYSVFVDRYNALSSMYSV